jgi:dTDP-4-dehydrorhamnose reductase
MENSGLLVIGGDGVIGSALVAAGQPCHWTTRRDIPGALRLDLAGAVEDFVPPTGVTVAVLSAAQARLDRCEAEPDAAARINVAAPARLAAILAARGIRPLLLSTSLVHAPCPLAAEDSAPAPITAYGAQKAAAERAVLACPGGMVLRLSKVLAPGNGVFTTWLDELAAGRPIQPFSDMVMAPVALPVAVAAILVLARGPAEGIYQLSAECDISYAEAAAYLARAIGADSDLVRPKSFRDVGLPEAFVPAHTSLSMRRLSALGVAQPEPWTALDWLVARWRNADWLSSPRA